MVYEVMYQYLFTLPLLTDGHHALTTRPHCYLCAGTETKSLLLMGALHTVSELLRLHMQLPPWVLLVWGRTGDLAVQN